MSYDINIKHLEYFIKVARFGSINKAAQVLFISQPYLGKIIRDLEENLGVLLFNRTSQGVTLTPEGEEFLGRAIKILKEMDGFCSQGMSGMTEMQHLSVSMTKFSHVMEGFIDIVLRYRNQPSFNHRLYEGNPDEVIEDVYSGRADVGIFHFDSRRRSEMEEELDGKGLSYRFLAYVEPHIVISKNHPLVMQNKPITLQALKNYGYIRYLGQYDDMAYSMLGSHAQQNSDGHVKSVSLSSRGTLMQLISTSDFYGIGIHDFGLQKSIYQAISVPISDSDFMFEFGYVTMKDVPLVDIAKEFIEDVKKRLT